MLAAKARAPRIRAKDTAVATVAAPTQYSGVVDDIYHIQLPGPGGANVRFYDLHSLEEDGAVVARNNETGTLHAFMAERVPDAAGEPAANPRRRARGEGRFALRSASGTFALYGNSDKPRYIAHNGHAFAVVETIDGAGGLVLASSSGSDYVRQMEQPKLGEEGAAPLAAADLPGIKFFVRVGETDQYRALAGDELLAAARALSPDVTATARKGGAAKPRRTVTFRAGQIHRASGDFRFPSYVSVEALGKTVQRPSDAGPSPASFRGEFFAWSADESAIRAYSGSKEAWEEAALASVVDALSQVSEQAYAYVARLNTSRFVDGREKTNTSLQISLDTKQGFERPSITDGSALIFPVDYRGNLTRKDMAADIEEWALGIVGYAKLDPRDVMAAIAADSARTPGLVLPKRSNLQDAHRALVRQRFLDPVGFAKAYPHYDALLATE